MQTMPSSSESTLVVMAGLPGSGKSTLARGVAAELGAMVLDKDQIRAALFPAELIEFSRRQDDFCMEVLLQTAGYLIRESEVPWIFVDGRPFVHRQQLERVQRAAEEIGCRLKIILCRCSDESARQRLQGAHVAANRNWELHQRLNEEFEPIELPHLVIDTEKQIERSVAEALAFLRLQT